MLNLYVTVKCKCNKFRHI